MKVKFCGAFNGETTLRPGETLEEAGQRIEATLQRVLDAGAKRLDVAVGVDFGDLSEVES